MGNEINNEINKEINNEINNLMEIKSRLNEMIRKNLVNGKCVKCDKGIDRASKRYGIFYCIDCCKEHGEEYEILRKIFYKY